MQRSEQCKFRGCLHENEPRCAVKSAVEAGEDTCQPDMRTTYSS